jgi:hypothetical protein
MMSIDNENEHVKYVEYLQRGNKVFMADRADPDQIK